MPDETLGAFIRRQRQRVNERRRESGRANLSQQAIAKELGFSQPWMAKVESDGLSEPPRREVLRALATVFASDLPWYDQQAEADKLYDEMLALAGYTPEPAREADGGPDADLLRELARYGIDIRTPMPRRFLALILEAVQKQGMPLIIPDEGPHQGRGAEPDGEGENPREGYCGVGGRRRVASR